MNIIELNTHKMLSLKPKKKINKKNHKHSTLCSAAKYCLHVSIPRDQCSISDSD